MFVFVRSLMVTCMALIMLMTTTIWATDPKPEGSSSGEAKQMALRQIPLQLLNEPARQKLVPCSKIQASFDVCRLNRSRSTPELFAFLVRHP